MSNFSTTALLDLQLDQQSLRNTKQEISEALDNVTVEVSAGGAMPDTGRGRSGPSSRDAMRSTQTQTEHLEDAVYYLESIDDVLSEGGLLGGGGGMAAEILGIGGDFAAEGAGAAADTVSGLATDVAGTALGQAAGSVIARQISGSTVGVEPNPLPVEGGSSGGTDVTVSPDVRFSPTIEPTFQPDLGPDINLPDLNLGIPNTLAVNRDPLPVQRDPLPVEKIEPLAVEDVGPITLAVETSGRGGNGSSGGDTTLNDDAFQRGIRRVPFVGGVLGDVDAELRGMNTRFATPNDPTERPRSGQSGSVSRTGRVDVSVDHSPTYRVDVDPRRLDSLADRIISEIEDGVERDLNALKDDVSELERELQELENEITR